MSFISKVKLTSSLSTHSTHKVGAIAFKKGRMISSGANSDKTHPKMIRFGKQVSCHAEWTTIMKLKRKNLLKGSTFIVYREKKNGSIGNARPCELCMPILISLGVEKVIYSTDTGWKTEKLK